MKRFEPVARRLGALAQRLDALSLRERGLIFLAGATLVYIAWQTLLMGPLAAREHNAEQRLVEARRHQGEIDKLGAVATGADPALAADLRNRALKERVAALDLELRTASQGYVAPGRMTEMLREILAEQRGLKLLALKNLPVESLSQKPRAAAASGAAPDAAVTGAAGAPEPADIGPFLHPVELVVQGDYGSVVAYLRSLEALPWRIHWRQLELKTQEYPTNTVHLVIGALSLSRDWIDI